LIDLELKASTTRQYPPRRGSIPPGRPSIYHKRQMRNEGRRNANQRFGVAMVELTDEAAGSIAPAPPPDGVARHAERQKQGRRLRDDRRGELLGLVGR
jgi:hypothetical protein